jgi:hypothetical protein
MNHESLDDRLDQLVARYAERLARGDARAPTDLLSEAPESARVELGRCLRLMEAAHRSGAAAPTPIGVGSVLDGMRIERELGRGGMAVVYLATQLDLNRSVALKVLRPGLALDERPDTSGTFASPPAGARAPRSSRPRRRAPRPT